LFVWLNWLMNEVNWRAGSSIKNQDFLITPQLVMSLVGGSPFIHLINSPFNQLNFFSSLQLMNEGKLAEAEMKSLVFIGVEWKRGRGLVPSHNPQQKRERGQHSINSLSSTNIHQSPPSWRVRLIGFIGCSSSLIKEKRTPAAPAIHEEKKR